MLCPKCKGKTKVTNTTQSKDDMETTRYLTCIECNYRFNTIERLPSGWICEDRHRKLIRELSRLCREYEVS